jgi:hypothetical protein
VPVVIGTVLAISGIVIFAKVPSIVDRMLAEDSRQHATAEDAA